MAYREELAYRAQVAVAALLQSSWVVSRMFCYHRHPTDLLLL